MSEAIKKAGGMISLPQQKMIQDKFKEVSSLYEKQFLREMMKSMRSTVSESGFIQANQAEKIFREKLDHEYVEKWGDRGGIGMADLIYNQLMEKFGAKMGLSMPVEKPRGPIQMGASSEYTGITHRVSGQDEKNSITYQIKTPPKVDSNETEVDITAKPVASAKLVAPWSGQVLNKWSLENQGHVIELQHDNGFKSHLSFQGSLLGFQKGDQVQAGTQLGLLKPGSENCFWKVQSVETSSLVK